MSQDVLVSMIASGVLLAVPIAWAAVGEGINEKAGVINIGIEGVMLFGALACSWGLQTTGGFTAGFIAAIAIGIVIGLALAFLWITRQADQIVTGIMFNLLALGLTTVIWAEALQAAGRVTKLPQIEIPWLAGLPIVGQALFSQNWTFYAVIMTAILASVVMYKSAFGLELRAVGENPQASDSAGVSVARVRYVSVIAGCVLMAVAGAALVASTSGKFFPGMTNGRGFIALAVVVLARWHPPWMLAAASLVGLSWSLQFHAQSIGPLRHVPTECWLMLPYVVTIGAMLLARRSNYPAALATPYRRRDSS